MQRQGGETAAIGSYGGLLRQPSVLLREPMTQTELPLDMGITLRDAGKLEVQIGHTVRHQGILGVDVRVHFVDNVDMRIAQSGRSVFGRRQVPVEAVRGALWTSTDATAYEGLGEKYQAHVLEQYKLYVEMTDRFTARRSLHNTFFLTVNTGAVVVTSTLLQGVGRDRHLLILPLAMLLIQCGAWHWILKSYRQLSSAKFRVIGAMEERLPASPYWNAEWKAVGSGRDFAIYLPITRLEQWTPVTFAAAYLAIFFLVLLPA